MPWPVPGLAAEGAASRGATGATVHGGGEVTGSAVLFLGRSSTMGRDRIRPKRDFENARERPAE